MEERYSAGHIPKPLNVVPEPLYFLLGLVVLQVVQENVECIKRK